MLFKSSLIGLLILAFLCCSQLAAPPSVTLQEKHLQLATQYTFKLQPNTSIIIFANSSSSSNLYLDFSSTFPFQSCAWDNNQCKSIVSQHKMHEGMIQINHTETSLGLMIKNPHQTLYLKLTVSIHEVSGDCRPISARQVYRKQLSGNVCFVHDIESQKDMEVMLQSESFQINHYKFELCKKSIELPTSDGNRFLLKEAVIFQNCNGFQEKIFKIEASMGDTKSDDDTSNTLMIVLQYPEEPILLLDGIGYSTSLKISPKVFHFELVNTLNTTINVESQKPVQIFAKVVKQQLVDETLPSQKTNDFSSKSGIIFIYYKPFLTITEQELKQINCAGCYLVISVVHEDKDQSEENITIEVVQHSSVLIQGKMKHLYLPKGSTAYYSYISNKMKTIYIQISDNNHYCSKVYFSDIQNPSESNHLLKYEKKQIVYTVKKDERYYVAVQATSNCAYSLVLYDSTNNITYLEKGRFGFLNLKQGESKVFLIMADSSQYLKFISMHVYGNVKIYLNSTTLAMVNILKNYDYNFSAFQRSGKYANRLILQKNDPIFCERCFFLIGVVAVKHTESSLFYGDENTAVPIRDKRFNDIIPKKGTIVKGEYYGQTNSQYEVKVISGKLRVVFKNGEKTYEKEYAVSKANYKDTFDLSVEKGLFDKIAHLLYSPPINIEFQAMEDDTVYSILIKSKTKAKDTKPTSERTVKCQNVSLTPGDDQYAMVTPLLGICISGHLRDKQERVIITSDFKERHLLDNLNITARINNKPVQLKLQKAQNIIAISFPTLKYYLMNTGVAFEMIVSISTARVWFFVLQEEDFSVLPAEVDYLATEKYTFVTHAQSDLVVDLFQCKGKASLVFGSSIKELQEKKKKELDLTPLGNQMHAIRINRFSTTFFRVTAPKAIVRWFPMDVENQLGTGYLDYEVGHLIYASALKGIELTWRSLAPKKKSQNQLVSVNYTLFIAADEESLKAVSQCQLTDGLNIYKQANILSPSQSLMINSTFMFTLRRDTLAKQFNNKPLFATIVADVQILPKGQTNKSETERYRFIYQYTQIPAELLAITYIDHISNMHASQVVVLSLLVVLIITAIAYLCLKKILPLLGILKNRMLVQEAEEQRNPGTEAHQGLSEIPPSSDRQGIQDNEILEKDDYIEAK